MDEAYIEKRREVAKVFVTGNLVKNSTEVCESPCGKYRLTTNRYSTGPRSWAYSRGEVVRTSNGELLADVKRNIGHFWHLFTSHSNGNDYFLCGEDYQGYSVYNLTTGVSQVHFPSAGHQGFGFCWTDAHPSPDGLVLAVIGCVWAAPYEIVFYDFRNPDELPLTELASIDSFEKEIGWRDNSTFVFNREVHYRISDGKSYEDLSEAEQEMIDDNEELAAYRSETVEFPRPVIEHD